MDITWYGHSCFRLGERGVAIITDPPTDDLGYARPRIRADVITISHEHPGHNNRIGFRGGPKVFEGPGEYEVKGVFITGIATYHDARSGASRGSNTVFLFEFDGVTICHLGDLGHVPTQAQVVIIGGGVIGCSVAYHLTKLGWRDVVLLEQTQLTAGTTWHAAGLIVSGFSTETDIHMATYTRDLYERLGEETGQDTGFKAVGYLQVASNSERMENLRRRADYCRAYGVSTEEISATEVKKMWPLFYTGDILAGFYTAEDGRTNPIDTTVALAKGARMGGARILEGARVTGIKQSRGRVTGVITDRGEIEAEYVVNCGGMWARELGQMAGVHVPLHAAEHYYLITEPIEGMRPDMPIVEDPDLFAYYRDEMGGLMIGLFEPVAKPWGMAKPGSLGAFLRILALARFRPTGIV